MRIEVIVPVRMPATVLPDCRRRSEDRPSRRRRSLRPSRRRTTPRELVVASSTDGDLAVPGSRESTAGDRGSGLNVALATLDAWTEAVAMVDAQSRPRTRLPGAVGGRDGGDRRGGRRRGDAPSWRGSHRTRDRGGVVVARRRGGLELPFRWMARDVESVYLGVYRRSMLDTVGRYDPSLLRTEDDDMNARIRAVGGRIRLDPSIRSRYLGRQTLRGLFFANTAAMDIRRWPWRPGDPVDPPSTCSRPRSSARSLGRH